MKPTYKQYFCRRSSEKLCANSKRLIFLAFLNSCLKRLMLKVSFLILLTSLLIGSFLVLSAEAAPKTPGKFKILLLMSYDRTNSWTEDILEGVLATVESNKKHIELFVEYMDTKRFLSQADSQLKRFGIIKLYRNLCFLTPFNGGRIQKSVHRTLFKERLPENSIVANQAFSFYEKYTIYVWLGIIIIIIQSLSISGLIINVRLRRRGQRALAASEKKFRSYMENAPDAIMIVNGKGQFLDFNQAACNLLGYTRQELLKKSIMDISPEDSHDQVWAHFERVLTTGKTDGVLPFRRSNGENRWWSVDAAKLTSERYIGFARDVTESRRAETVLLNARQKELQVGIEIQNQLLLGKTPTTLKGAKIAACSIPSDYIDGDFYDFIQYDNQHFDLILGDVMGKGVSAALCGAATKAQFLRVIYDLMCSSTLATIPTIEEIVSFSHKQMCKKLMKIESFVTTCVARFNLRKMRMDIIDCGHPSTIHYHADTQTCDLIVGKNFPIGFSENETYEQLSVHFKVGDILFFHSDGVMETKDHNNNIYGMKRLEQFIRDNSELSPDELTKKLASDLKHFSNNKFNDDITYIFVKFEESLSPELLRSTASEFSSEFENVNKIREMIEADISGVQGVDTRFCAELILAVSEAVTNIIKHAYDYKPDCKIFVGIEIYTDHIEIILSHCGTAMEKRQFTTPSFDGTQNNGYGLYLIRNCVDEIKLSKDDHGIISMQLIKNISSDLSGESSVKRF